MKTVTRHILLLFALLAVSCEQDFVVYNNDPCDGSDPSIICPPAPVDDCPDDATAGSIDLTKFVAIGNSMGAGYQAGALFSAGQDNSLPRILATQFACAGGTPTFNQPDIESVNGFNSTFSDVSQGIILGRLVLFTPPGGRTLPTPAGTPGLPPPFNTADLPGPYTGDKAALNNFSVPGILLGQALIPQTGGPPTSNPAFNPYYARFASNPGTSTILGDAIAAQGTFYLFSLGLNDVLGYAISGASNEEIFTSAEDFATQYNAAFGTLLGALPTAKGVVTNIPDPLLLPYFNMVPWDAIELDATLPGVLNSAFEGFNAVLDGLVVQGFLTADDAAERKVSYKEGVNPVLIFDEDLEDLGPYFDALLGMGAITVDQRNALAPYEQARPIKNTEFVTFPAALVLGTLVDPNNPTSAYGIVVPAADEYVITETEAEVIRQRTEAFNQTIATAVAGSGDRYALADVHAKLSSFATTGFDFSGGVVLGLTLEPPTGIFSEDGLHPNNRGYAYLANFIIDTINAKFGATIPRAIVGEYTATGLPLVP
ncbi:MAG: hypothetical protein LOY03_13195 [Cyclobacteriaceae bacterium]|nr:hypothetical protein [Cyclobacteriaceae bacterium]